MDVYNIRIALDQVGSLISRGRLSEARAVTNRSLAACQWQSVPDNLCSIKSILDELELCFRVVFDGDSSAADARSIPLRLLRVSSLLSSSNGHIKSIQEQQVELDAILNALERENISDYNIDLQLATLIELSRSSTLLGGSNTSWLILAFKKLITYIKVRQIQDMIDRNELQTHSVPLGLINFDALSRAPNDLEALSNLFSHLLGQLESNTLSSFQYKSALKLLCFAALVSPSFSESISEDFLRILIPYLEIDVNENSNGNFGSFTEEMRSLARNCSVVESAARAVLLVGGSSFSRKRALELLLRNFSAISNQSSSSSSLPLILGLHLCLSSDHQSSSSSSSIGIDLLKRSSPSRRISSLNLGALLVYLGRLADAHQILSACLDQQQEQQHQPELLLFLALAELYRKSGDWNAEAQILRFASANNIPAAALVVEPMNKRISYLEIENGNFANNNNDDDAVYVPAALIGAASASSSLEALITAIELCNQRLQVDPYDLESLLWISNAIVLIPRSSDASVEGYTLESAQKHLNTLQEIHSACNRTENARSDSLVVPASVPRSPAALDSLQNAIHVTKMLHAAVDSDFQQVESIRAIMDPVLGLQARNLITAVSIALLEEASSDQSVYQKYVQFLVKVAGPLLVPPELTLRLEAIIDQHELWTEFVKEELMDQKHCTHRLAWIAEALVRKATHHFVD